MSNKRIMYPVAAVFLCSLGMPAAQNAAGNTDVPEPAATAVVPAKDLPGKDLPGKDLPGKDIAGRSYLLGPGDQIVIRAANAPDISEKPIRIDPTGIVNMPTIGRIHAAGLTVEALEAELVKRLKVYLEEPDVAVSLTEYHSQPVSIFGEVMTPGVHQLEGRKTLVEMLSLAGGLKEDAGPSVRLTRRLEYGRIPLPGAADDATGQFSIAELPLKPLIDAKTPDKDILVQPYDTISVPKAEFVYIAGDVTKAGAVPLTDAHSISVMEALSTSGGLLKTAAPNKSRILRPAPGASAREQVPVDVNKIMNGKAEDVRLRAGDILYIPGSAAKRASTRAIEAAVQVSTVILTYGVIR
jgi:polysaccharide biosynthesis/export protein